VNLVVGTLELTTISGVGTYVVTVAEQLERMGHGVTILTQEMGEMGAIAEGRGLRVVTEPGELPDCDAVYAQDAPSAYTLADRYQGVPQAFCVHATEHDRWLVPQLAGMTSATVTLDEQAARFAGSLGHVPEVVRLRQPVDTRRFSPRGPIGASPGRVLALGNYTSGNRLELISEACSAAGIELVQRGLQGGGFVVSPESEINDSDIVVGRSRVIIEAMACGRAAYIYDDYGGDGWVTPDRYPLLAADGFDGQAEARPIDAGRLREDLEAYRADMGPVNRDLAVSHHSARKHCEALLELFRRLAPRGEGPAPLEELSRLTRVQWQADSRALGFENEARRLRAELGRRNSEQAELHEETARAQHRAAEAEQRAAAAEREARLRAWPLYALRRLRKQNR
jgi:hypothetical protein